MCRRLIGCQVILIHPTLVYQCSKIGNLLMPKHTFQLGLQTRFKLRTFGPSVHLQFSVWTKSGQFLELGRIFSHGHITLLQLQKLHFFLPLQISRKIFLKKFLLEGNPGNHSPFCFHLSPSKFSPSFSFLHQHVRSIRHLLNVSTTHGSEYSFQVLNPLVRSIRSEPTLELARILFA
ncbi:hypothetical protein Lalb_Chr19g0127831 [Lupinus albus]|uniref:Uncharacterized protein n=1 Tax=Lupinus albus TaxID=3870 RepID=A0A6A4P110_LUPAL|nr:hypothetical protein Lalb_Chr19g0127831 [Lupinus albus]